MKSVAARVTMKTTLSDQYAEVKRALPLLTGIALLLLSGCLTTTVRDARHAPGRSVKRWNHFWLLGTIGQADVDARDLCPEGVSRVESYSDVLTLGLSLATLGVYTPRRLEVVCAATSAGGR